MTSRHAGKVAFVTGAAAGMGLELTRQLAERGCTVVATDINGTSLQASIAALKEKDHIQTHVLDVTDNDRFRALLEETAQAHGSLDYLFNNAGIAIFGEARDMQRHQWQNIVDINLWGVLNGTTAAYDIMLRQGSGHIINTASGAGLAPLPMLTAYAMTKHAVVGLSTSLRAEAADFGVRVSVVCPGVINTSIFEHATGLGFDISALRRALPHVELPVDKAVKRILKGVDRNEGVMVFPAHAHALIALVRSGARIYEPLWGKGVRAIRARRKLAGED